jgi:hypothetical protein
MLTETPRQVSKLALQLLNGLFLGFHRSLTASAPLR